jgi:hypothetical protein
MKYVFKMQFMLLIHFFPEYKFRFDENIFDSPLGTMATLYKQILIHFTDLSQIGSSL